VTRPLLYRWWPTKPALVSDALFHGLRWPTRFPGPLERDLRSFVGALVAYARRPEVRSGLLGIMAEARDTEELPALTELVGGLQESFCALLSAGVARGDVRDGVDPAMTLDTVRGAVTAHVVVDERPRKQVVDHLVQLLTWALAR
jgi:hypothetical protein